MHWETDFNRLCDFVREVRQYYSRDRRGKIGNLVMSKAMVSFALNDLSEAELNGLIQTLEYEGAIVSNTNGQLTFSANFPGAVC